jgi:hypothetical protein
MKKMILLLSFLISLYSVGQEPLVQGQVFLAWNYPGIDIKNIFKIYRTTDSPTNRTRCWTVVKTASGVSRNTRADLVPGVQNYFFVTVSNVWGESMFFDNKYITPPDALR